MSFKEKGEERLQRDRWTSLEKNNKNPGGHFSLEKNRMKRREFLFLLGRARGSVAGKKFSDQTGS